MFEGKDVKMYQDTWPYAQRKIFCDGISDYVGIILEGKKITFLK